jgi:hypothetical protein
MSAGGVIGAIAAHTVITSTIRNQEPDAPVENTMTEEELTQSSHDFIAGYIKQVTWAFGIIITVMVAIAGLVWIFG